MAQASDHEKLDAFNDKLRKLGIFAYWMRQPQHKDPELRPTMGAVRTGMRTHGDTSRRMPAQQGNVVRLDPAGHLFFDNTHLVPREAPSAQEAIAKLDLNYYIPCRAQQRTVAVLGLGKTSKGDFLSSEDVELLETLGGYLGIAIQNGQLYASLQQKVAEYERLKDFNENIVESINVGVMALDMEAWAMGPGRPPSRHLERYCCHR